MLNKCIDTNSDPHIALLQIRSTPVEQGLPSTVTLLFKHPIGSIMLILNRPPVNTDNDDEDYEKLVQRQVKTDKIYDALRNYSSIPKGSTVAVQRRDRGLWNHATIVHKGGKSHKH